MPGLDTLLACAGHWAGINHLQELPDAAGED
jgi:hypothetical protein